MKTLYIIGYIIMIVITYIICRTIIFQTSKDDTNKIIWLSILFSFMAALFWPCALICVFIDELPKFFKNIKPPKWL